MCRLTYLFTSLLCSQLSIMDTYTGGLVAVNPFTFEWGVLTHDEMERRQRSGCLG